MSIVLCMQPQIPPMGWDDFCLEQPPFSVALDGFVADGPRFEAKGPRANFNHHECVDRLATRATCAQVNMAIRQGLFQSFRDAEGPRMVVTVNDCDQDVCLSWFQLKHHYLAEQAMNPALNRLVSMEDALDTTAGAYPFPSDLPALQELAWVFEPYAQFRLAGGLARRDPEAFASIVNDVELRIMAHVTGRGKMMSLQTEYERLGGGKGWNMVREIGAQARTAMFAEGIKAYVSVRQRGDGVYDYVYGRMSVFIPFGIMRILARANEIEGLVSSADRHGGNDIIGGSPRIAGSKIPPREMERLVNEVAL